MFEKLSEKPVAEVQKEQVAEWNEENLLKKCVDAREGKPQFVFYEGPPTANGKPGIHHVMARTLKDSINRYKTMQGFQVNRKAGWDTHGLPVEIEVEKQLGINGKQEIEEYGIRQFNKKCRESVFTYTGLWRDMSERMGYMADMDDPYITLDNKYIETEWWIVKKFFDEDMIYEGHKILPYCPRCGTGLASHEVAQGYKDVKVNTLTVKFKKTGAENEYFLAWTTTPWTLAANTVLTVGPDFDYIKVRMTAGDDKGNVFYLAKALADKILGEGNYEVLEEMKGKDLEYMEYEQLMPFVKADRKAFFITCMDYVSIEDGTGIVHSAPAFGEDDYQCGRKYNLPMLQPVDEKGEYTETPWKGHFVMEEGLDVEIIRYLAKDNKIFAKEKISHNYPHCWRCGTPLVYYAKPSWYIEMSRLKEQLVENNNSVNWFPPFVGEKRFGNWLSEVKDWAISRSRYWGTPIPVIYDEDGNIYLEEEENLPVKLPTDIEFNGKGNPLETSEEFKNVILPNGKKGRRETDTMDTFVDSSWYYLRYLDSHNADKPFEKADADAWTPVNQYIGGIEHAVMHLLYARFFHKSLRDLGYVDTNEPFKKLLTQGMVLGPSFYSQNERRYLFPREAEFKDGKAFSIETGEELVTKVEKMSKSKNNGVDPEEIVKEYGADSSRVFTLFAAPPEKELEWNMNGLAGAYRFINRLYLLVSGTAEFSDHNAKSENHYGVELKKRNQKDEEIQKKLHQTVKKVTESIEDDFHFNTAIAAVMELLNDMTTYKQEVIDKDNISSESKKIWREVLEKTILLIAPFAPHVADELWAYLGNKTFTFEEEWPKYDEELTKDHTFNLVIQVNGKVRDMVSAQIGISKDDAEKLALESEKAKKFIDGKEVVKVIVVPNKLVNVVVKG